MLTRVYIHAYRGKKDIEAFSVGFTLACSSYLKLYLQMLSIAKMVHVLLQQIQFEHTLWFELMLREVSAVTGPEGSHCFYS